MGVRRDRLRDLERSSGQERIIGKGVIGEILDGRLVRKNAEHDTLFIR